MSREGASLASRTSIDPQEIMNTLANTAQPLTMGSDGMMYVTKVTYKNSNPIITQEAWHGKSGPTSAIGDASSVAKVLGTIKVNDGDSFYLFEVFYQYHSLFDPGEDYGAYSPQLHTIAIF
jgi:hypothetical protein